MPELFSDSSRSPSRPAEGDLVARLRSGDAKSFEELVRTYGGRMLAVARRLTGSDADAQDCLQDALLLAFRKIDTFAGSASLGTWLHRIAINSALQRLRGDKRRKEESVDVLLPKFDRDGFRTGSEAGKYPSVGEALERAELRDYVRRKIDELPPSYRQVLVLRDIEGFDTAQTAELIEASIEVVKVRLHRARAALKKLIEPGMLDQL